ncbi:hypothetical protein B0H11DRAFT_1356270 [Mycena galericulata]|nr:hypothetical protein B0H11DRAFT_1356270 [Mycena galericulata]
MATKLGDSESLVNCFAIYFFQRVELKNLDRGDGRLAAVIAWLLACPQTGASIIQAWRNTHQPPPPGCTYLLLTLGFILPFFFFFFSHLTHSLTHSSSHSSACARRRITSPHGPNQITI